MARRQDSAHRGTSYWKQLLATIKVETDMGQMTPVAASVLDKFERDAKIVLPRSYRSYCEVFGAGEFARKFQIAVPGFRGASQTNSLQGLQQLAHEELEFEEYSSDAEQHKRGVFFAKDILSTMYFFDPQDSQKDNQGEYGVFALFRDWEVNRVADGFAQFIEDVCLGDGQKQVIHDDEPAERVFRPIAK